MGTTTLSRKTRTPARAESPRVDAYQLITDQVVTMLENGTAPWHQTWSAGNGGVPTSMSSGKPYRGINPFLLMVTAQTNGYTSPWWGTYGQITERGGQVRKGEKSTLIVFWKRLDKLDKDTGKPVSIPMLRTFKVFNADQADGLPERYRAVAETRTQHDAIEACENAISGYLVTGPSLHTGDSAAYYQPSTDSVHMPDLDRFDQAEAYYAALFHELAHSTGHSSRLAREGVVEGHRFGDALYSKEELIAEMGSAFIAGATGVAVVTLPNSAAYLASWIRVLRSDHKLLIKAAAAAQKAADLIMSVTYD